MNTPNMDQPIWRALLCLALLVFCCTPALPAEEESSMVIRAAEAHIGDGKILENALIVIEDGQIKSISVGGEAPEGAKVREVAVITPGFIDANTRFDVADASYYPGEDPRLQILKALGKEDLYHGGDVCPCGTT